MARWTTRSWAGSSGELPAWKNPFHPHLRSLGLGLTESELAQSMKELCADGVNTLEFPDFIKMLYKRIKQKDSDDELRNAFKELDEENTGRVKASELRRLLVEMVGEQGEEVDAMLKEGKVDREGFINYEDFIAFVMA